MSIADAWSPVGPLSVDCFGSDPTSKGSIGGSLVTIRISLRAARISTLRHRAAEPPLTFQGDALYPRPEGQGFTARRIIGEVGTPGADLEWISQVTASRGTLQGGMIHSYALPSALAAVKGQAR